MGRSKGVVFTATRKFTEDRFGKDAVEVCLDELDARDQTILRDIEPMGWYPLDPVVRYMRALDRLYGKGDLGLCADIGHFSADWNLSGFQKLMLRFAPGDWLWQRGFRFWSQYHDTGRWESEKPAANALVGRLYDFVICDEAWCRRFQGFLERAVILTGARDPECHHTRCVVRGDVCCEFSGTWR